MTFSESLLVLSEPIRARISAHPFVQGIGDGTLAADRFRFYMGQDYLFLIDYCRVLSLAATKAPDLATMGRFAELLHSTLSVEMDLHRAYAAEFGITRADLESTSATPTTRAYVAHLLNVAWAGGIADIAVSLLPCQWGYWELGCELAERTKASDPGRYRRWVEAYSSPDYGELATWLRSLVDELAEGRRRDELARMRLQFIASSRYELMFWDMAWKGEEWP